MTVAHTPHSAELKQQYDELSEELPKRACDLGLLGCHVCGLASEARAPETQREHSTHRCPRCHSALHARKPNSLSRAWAFLLAALVVYIPANVLPVMYTSLLGRGSESTIVGGVVDFWESGAWDIATIIFVASIAVPIVKFLVLGLLLFTSQRRSTWANRQRARLYRLIELIGYWSMLDVAVVTLVCALVRFRLLGTAEPRLGIVFFGAAVLLTMLAAMSFDPRLIWDGEANDGNA
jgi:paraquat-inducible protein A